MRGSAGIDDTSLRPVLFNELAEIIPGRRAGRNSLILGNHPHFFTGPNGREERPDGAEMYAEAEDVQVLEEVVHRDRDDDPDTAEGEGAREGIARRPPHRADAVARTPPIRRRYAARPITPVSAAMWM